MTNKEKKSEEIERQKHVKKTKYCCLFDSRDPYKSILVISQFPVSSWYDMFQEHTYAEACLARLQNDAYRLEMNGKNMRNIEPINKQP